VAAKANYSVVLRQRPEGVIAPDDLELTERPLPAPAGGQLLVRVQFLSLDPYMASAVQQRHPSGAVFPGDVMPAEVVGVVEQSRHPDFAEGDVVLTRGGWSTFCLADGDAPASGLQGILSAAAHRLPPPPPGIPASVYLGLLGMPGLTAYAIMIRTLRPQPGETVAVFAAAGAVGSAAGQLARLMGARTVGIVGSEAKAAHARDVLAYDAAVVRGGDDFPERLAVAAPRRLDAVVSNVCGSVFESVLWQLAHGGRVAFTGDVAQYNSREILPSPSLSPLLAARATMTGFVVYDHYDLLPRWREIACEWLVDGKLVLHEDLTEGLERAPEAFARLMRGETTGKTIVAVG
jgi:NADPH-dependent curcumin reductase CurA